MKPLRIAIAGLGTVGGGVADVLLSRGRELAERAGRPLELVGVSARDRKKKRATDISHLEWATDPASLAKSDADVIVELIGGEEGVARTLVEASLAAKKHVVTANKALLALHGARLAALAEANNVSLKFEAAAAGGIPIVKALRESLIAYGIDAVRGILNGTCNYILTQMEATGRTFEDVLKEAQKLGFAEADPTLDIGGGDTAHKLALLSALAFGIAPNLDNMKIGGIAHITPEDIGFAREFGYRIKLLGIARRVRRRHRSACGGIDGARGHAARRCRRPVQCGGGRCGCCRPVLLRRARRGRSAHRFRRCRRSCGCRARSFCACLRPCGEHAYHRAAAAETRANRLSICASGCWTCRACWRRSLATSPNRMCPSKA